MNKPHDSGPAISPEPPAQAPEQSAPGEPGIARPVTEGAGEEAPVPEQPSEPLGGALGEQSGGLPAYMRPQASPLARAAGAENAKEQTEGFSAPDFVLVAPKEDENNGETVADAGSATAEATAADAASVEAEAQAAETAVAEAKAAEAAAAEAAARAAALAAEAAAKAARAKAEAAAAASAAAKAKEEARAKAAPAGPQKTPPPGAAAGKPAPGKAYWPKGGAGKTPAAPQSSFFRSHPVLPVASAEPHTVSSRLFNLLALLPIVPLTLMLAAQTIFSLNARDLWYSDEIRHADAFQNLLHHGKWLVLELNGQPYPDKPPLYFWFLRGLHEIFRVSGLSALVRTDGAFLFFAGTAVSALAYLWSTLALGRLVARFDGRGVFASGIVLLSLGYIMGVVHYARMDLLFSALIVASHVALYHLWLREKAPVLAVVGFGLAGVACLVKGPLGLALPLASSILFLIWSGRPLRLFRLDVAVGLLAGLAVPGAWLAAVYTQYGQEFVLNAILQKQVLQRAVNTFHHREPWHYYLVRLPLMLLPWALLFFFLPWKGLLGKHMRSAVAASRKPEAEGLGFLWCMVIAAVALLSVLSGKIHIYLLPVLPALALILGRAALQLSGARAALFRHVLAAFLLLAGVAALVAALMLFGVLPMPAFKGVPAWNLPFNMGFFVVSAGFMVAALLLWLLVRGARPEGTLLVMALACTALSFPLANLAAPSFSAVLSPRAQAEVMRSYIDKGYRPVSFNDYGGTYSYYTGKIIKETRDLSELAALIKGGKVILAIKAKDWDSWKERPQDCKEVNRQWIETGERLLLACPPIQEAAAPAEAPAAPAKEPEAAAPAETPAAPAKEPEAAAPAETPAAPAKEPETAAPAGTPAAPAKEPEAAAPAEAPAAAPVKAPELPGEAKPESAAAPSAPSVTEEPKAGEDGPAAAAPPQPAQTAPAGEERPAQ